MTNEKQNEKKIAIIKVVDLMVRFKITPQDIVDELSFAVKLHNEIVDRKKK